MPPMALPKKSATIDRNEIARFAKLADDWWDAKGPFAPLHQIGPIRLTHLRDQLCEHFRRDPKAPPSLTVLAVRDIGCGGGILTESLAAAGDTSGSR